MFFITIYSLFIYIRLATLFSSNIGENESKKLTYIKLFPLATILNILHSTVSLILMIFLGLNKLFTEYGISFSG